MKIGIISDLHLGHKNSCMDVFKCVLEKLNREVDIVVDCGDLTDSNNLNSTQLTDLYDIFNSVNIPWHIIRGNHDSLSNLTTAKLLELNKYIHVHEIIEYENFKNINFLFVPYYKDINLMKSILKDKETYADFAFSHLNLTNNIYADIPFSKAKDLFKYSPYWINGHIHTPESYSDLFGKVENIGAISSLTYGDEHIPLYGILDTDTKILQRYEINNCIIHKTCNPDYNFDNFQQENKHRFINWRVKLPNTFFIEERNKIREKLKQYPNTFNIQFDFVKDSITKNKKVIVNKKENVSLIEQLFNMYEDTLNVKLCEDIKNSLI